MHNQAIEEILTDLLGLTSENEVVEFKEAKNTFDSKKLGKYFSALSNEANLKGKPNAWLVFGVTDKTHEIVGTQYRSSKKDLENLKAEIADKTINRITFIEIHELYLPKGRVLMFQIPAAPKGIPISFEGHYYGRDGENLVPLNLEEIERIRLQHIAEDWSAGIVPHATINDLDEDAIALARKNYKNKFPEKAEEMSNWDDKTFLNKAKITIKGKITRTAIILLGKEESEHFINPSEAKIRWILKDERGVERDYLIVGSPMLLAVDKIYNKIRNLKYRYLEEGSLFPEEQYRNPFLASAMFNLKMVDTIGSGIRKIYDYQRERFFPMPEYDLSNRKVKVTIFGKVLDLNYARLLAQNKNLTLEEIITLDRVQKHKSLTNLEEKHLKKRKLIEGRKPNFYISINIAQETGQKAEYSKNKAFEKQYYLDLILKALREHKNMNRKDIDELLWNKLPDWMNDEQKSNKVKNLIFELRYNNTIINKGTRKSPIWILR